MEMENGKIWFTFQSHKHLNFVYTVKLGMFSLPFGALFLHQGCVDERNEMGEGS